MGPAATVFNQGSDDKLLPVERRISVFSSSLAIDIAPRPFSPRMRAQPYPRKTSCWTSQNSSPDCLVRGCRTCGSSGMISASRRWICSMGVSSCSSALLVRRGNRPRRRLQPLWRSSWQPTALQRMESCVILKMAGKRGWGCQPRARCCGTPRTASWLGGLVPCRAVLSKARAGDLIHPVPAHPGSGRAEGTCRSAWFEHEPHPPPGCHHRCGSRAVSWIRSRRSLREPSHAHRSPGSASVRR